jgi:hypothetical protein
VVVKIVLSPAYCRKILPADEPPFITVVKGGHVTATATRHVLIVGGIPALIVALPLAARSDLRITVIDDRPRGEEPAGVFVSADDFSEALEGLLDSVVVAGWDAVIHTAGSAITQPRRRMRLVHEAQLRAELAQKPAFVTLVSAAPKEVGLHRVSTDRGSFSAEIVVDAREPQATGPDAIHILACLVALSRPHKLRQPVLVDTGTAAGTGWSFYQYLPVGQAQLQIRAVGHGRPGRPIAIDPAEGKLLHSRRSCVPLVPQEPQSGRAITVPYGCPDPIFPSTIPMALAAGSSLAASPSFAEDDLHSVMRDLCDRETCRKASLASDCRKLAAIEPADRFKYLSPA